MGSASLSVAIVYVSCVIQAASCARGCQIPGGGPAGAGVFCSLNALQMPICTTKKFGTTRTCKNTEAPAKKFPGKNKKKEKKFGGSDFLNRDENIHDFYTKIRVL